MDNYTGRQIGHYRILRQLGTGAFATVYLAEHLYIEKLAAIKILHLAMEAHSHSTFQEEARINARLDHPHIIRLLDFGFYEQMPYLVMEYAPNGTLRQLYPQGQRMPPQQIIKYVQQIAEALDYAHQKNVIHRDVKPENLLLNSTYDLVLSDFGIAVVQQTQPSLSAQQIGGTPHYMAPEQFRGKSLPNSDQYALGIMVYEWICGEVPFSGNAFTLAYQHNEQTPTHLDQRLQGISPDVDDVVSRALAKDPAQRFAHVGDFAWALEKALFSAQLSHQNNTSVNQALDLPLHPSANTPFMPAMSRDQQSMPAPVAPNALQRIQVVPNQQQDHLNIPNQISSAPAPILTTDSPFPKTPSPPSQQNTSNLNRQRLLRRVRSFWIMGVLEQSVSGAALVELDLREAPDAVANPWQQILPPSYVLHRAEQRKSIMQYYHDADEELLILGAPGSGKTTVLLTLARDLLTQAEQNEQSLVPVVFNLSTWSHHQSLATWLVDELESKYQVKRKLGQQLMKADLILPLLDGLDEVASGERMACVEAINQYRRAYGSSPLVVCSRSADYLAQKERVLLNKAVMIQPLSMQQAYEYLAGAGSSLHALRVALQKETALRELMQTPLLLRMLALTYYNAPLPEGLSTSSPDEQIQQVLERYIERMLARGGHRVGYTPQETQHWLAWLARHLQQRNQKLFYIERLQPDCFEEQLTRQRYPRFIVGPLFGMAGGGLTIGFLIIHYWFSNQALPFFQNNNPVLLASLALLLVLINGVMVGWINGALYQRQTAKVVDSLAQQKWGRRGQRIVRGIADALIMGLFIGLPIGYTSIYYQASNLSAQMLLLLGTVAFHSFVGGLFLFMVDWFLDIQTTKIQPAEILAWSWSKFLRTFFKYLGIGFLYILALGLSTVGIFFLGSKWAATSNNSSSMYTIDLIIGGIGVIMLLVLAYTLVAALFKGITKALSTNILDTRAITTPNQGIRRSARHSLLIGLVSLFLLVGIPALIVTRFHFALAITQIIVISIMLIFVPIVLIIALRVGGMPCIQHFVLRWLLKREKAMPWNYPRFLDYASEHILLQKVGGGYMFVHRFVLEYFASLDIK